MENGEVAAEAMGLTIGVGLTAEQVHIHFVFGQIFEMVGEDPLTEGTFLF